MISKPLFRYFMQICINFRMTKKQLDSEEQLLIYIFNEIVNELGYDAGSYINTYLNHFRDDRLGTIPEYYQSPDKLYDHITRKKEERNE